MTKTISWGGENNTDFTFPSDSPGGYNLLTLSDSTEITGDTTYTVGLQKPGNWQVRFLLASSVGVKVDTAGGWGNYSSMYNYNGDTLFYYLSGKNEGDYISEFRFRLSGTGSITLTSNDLKITDGEFLNRTFFVK